MKSVQALLSLRGRVAVVTGGAGHLGRAMAEALAEAGAGVALLDVDVETATTEAERLADLYDVPACGLEVDLGEDRQVIEAPRRVVEALGRLDILINNAALVGTFDLSGWAVPFPEQTVGTWRHALDINLTAPFILVQAAREALQASGHGCIINIGSIYGMVAPDMRLYEGTRLGNPAAYAASKAGLLQFTRWLTTVLAPQIRANAITLGGVWRNQPPAFADAYTARTPLGRMAVEEDLKGAVVYLASDLSAYVTGHNLVIDGGFTAW